MELFVLIRAEKLAKREAKHLAKYTEANTVTQHVNLRRPVFKAVITAADRPAPRLLCRDLHNAGAVFHKETQREHIVFIS